MGIGRNWRLVCHRLWPRNGRTRRGWIQSHVHLSRQLLEQEIAMTAPVQQTMSGPAEMAFMMSLALADLTALTTSASKRHLPIPSRKQWLGNAEQIGRALAKVAGIFDHRWYRDCGRTHPQSIRPSVDTEDATRSSEPYWQAISLAATPRRPACSPQRCPTQRTR